MKILFISQYFYPENFRGNDIVFDFVKRGHNVTVLTAKPNYPQGKFYKGYNFFNKRQEIINGARVIRTPIIPRGRGKTVMMILNYVSFVTFSYFACLFRIKEKYDLIFVQQLSPVSMALPGLWIKKRQKIPLFLWVLDLWPESIAAGSNVKSNIILSLIDRLVRKIYKASDTILISSKFFKRSILEKSPDPSKRIIYFPNWAEDVFTTREINKRVIIPKLPSGFNIIFAGNIGEAQDFDSILMAAQLTLSDGINWILIGDGRKSDWIKNEIESRQLSNVYMLGRYPMNKMPLFFELADAMLVSLKEDPVLSFTVPAKIQAYMASGQIILGMLNGEGNTLINESGCGIAVAAGDYHSLARAVSKIKNMPHESKRQMKIRSLAFYEENFSKRMLFDELEAMFLEAKNDDTNNI